MHCKHEDIYRIKVKGYKRHARPALTLKKAEFAILMSDKANIRTRNFYQTSKVTFHDSKSSH